MSIPGNKPSLHGRDIGVSVDKQVVATGGFVSGGKGSSKSSIVFPSPDTVAIFDDFVGPAHDTGGIWGTIEGADTGASGSLGITSGAAGGIFSMAIPRNFALASAGALDIAALVSGRHFHANMDRVRISARLRYRDTGTTPNDISVFVGFTDDTGTIEVPMYVDTGTDNDSVHGSLAAFATNAMGMLFDTATDTGKAWTADTGDRRWHGVAVNAGTVIAGGRDTGGVTKTGGDGTPEADTGMTTNKWQDVEVVYRSGLVTDYGDTGGMVSFYLNGKEVGWIDSPVASSATLTPVISIGGHRVWDTGVGQFDTGNTQPFLDVDWVNVSAARDTGD